MIPTSKNFIPILIWGFIQIALLAICVGRVPLWAHHPYPRESLALPVMWCGQIIFCSLCFPVLMPDARMAVAVISMTIPFNELTGLLSNCSQIILLKGFSCFSVWSIGVWALGRLLESSQSRLAAIAVATLISVGGTIFDYLRWEQVANSPTPEAFRPISLLPKLCAISSADSSPPWIAAGLPILAFLSIHGFMVIKRQRRPLTSTLLHRNS
jgi:hypothetical protein